MDLHKYLKIFFPLIICNFFFTLAACVTGRIIENRFIFLENNYQVITLDNESWTIIPDYHDSDITYLNNECDGEIAILTIKTRKDVPYWHRLASRPIDKLANKRILSLKREESIDELLTYKEINISGVEALEIEYKGIYHGKEIYIRNREYIYILQYIITASYYDKYLEDFKKVTDSFEFLK